MTVSAPAITLFSLPATVGSGLQYGFFSGQLGGSQHGGVTVRLTSSNPAVMRLSPDAVTAGTPTVDLPLANGDVSFCVLHPRDGGGHRRCDHYGVRAGLYGFQPVSWASSRRRFN